MLRYEALFSLTEQLTTAETVEACAKAAATNLKHIANVAAWRVIVEREAGFLIIDGHRNGTAVEEVINLDPWDSERWAFDHPILQSRNQLIAPTGGPEHLTGRGIESLLLLPFVRSGQPRTMLAVAARSAEPTPLDLKFVNMAGSMLCDQFAAVILRRQMIQTLEDQAWRDGLTGIANRRAVMDALHKSLAVANRHGEALTVLLVDIDHFKKINDTYGHLIGDDVLRETAGRLTALTREGDLVGRYGGEEFLFILHHCNSDGARTVGERVRSRFSASGFTLNTPEPIEVPITLSVGGASTADNPGLNAEELMSRADEALYLAKKSGRNRLGLRLGTGLTVYAND